MDMQTIHKSFKYRIYPTSQQEELLQKTFGCCRYVYNRVLAEKEEEYEKTGKSSSINSYIAKLPTWKKELEWLKEVDSQALQQSLRNLEKAYKNFFKDPGNVGVPHFKNKNASRKAYRTRHAYVVDEKHIALPKLGAVKAKISRPCDGRVLSATISQVPSGKYYVSFCCECAMPHQKTAEAISVLGIHRGINALATCSNGEILPNPHFLTKREKQLKRAQRMLSRRKAGSNNQAKQRERVSRIHEHIANQRKDTLHKFSTRAVRENQTIAIEDLNVDGMKNIHHFAKALSDASMGELSRQLEYKCSWYGREFVKLDRGFLSLRKCSARKITNKELVILERVVFLEREWGHAVHDRNLVAAKNIANEAAQLLGRAGHARTTQNASGVDVGSSTGQFTLKEESQMRMPNMQKSITCKTNTKADPKK